MGRQVGGNGGAAQGDTGSQSTWSPGGKSPSHGRVKAALPDGRGPAKVRTGRGPGVPGAVLLTCGRVPRPGGRAQSVGPGLWEGGPGHWAPTSLSGSSGAEAQWWGSQEGPCRAWAVREVGVRWRAPWAGGNRPGPGAAEPMMPDGGTRDPGGREVCVGPCGDRGRGLGRQPCCPSRAASLRLGAVSVRASALLEEGQETPGAAGGPQPVLLK